MDSDSRCKDLLFPQGPNLAQKLLYLVGTVLNFFLDIVPSSSADNTRALRRRFRGGSVYVSFRFDSIQRKTSNAVGMSSLIFCLQAKGAWAFGMF